MFRQLMNRLIVRFATAQKSVEAYKQIALKGDSFYKLLTKRAFRTNK
jgi:hypothetical protein